MNNIKSFKQLFENNSLNESKWALKTLIDSGLEEEVNIVKTITNGEDLYEYLDTLTKLTDLEKNMLIAYWNLCEKNGSIKRKERVEPDNIDFFNKFLKRA
jgi:hypothetical protein